LGRRSNSKIASALVDGESLGVRDHEREFRRDDAVVLGAVEAY
jgi:hypothetical protein